MTSKRFFELSARITELKEYFLPEADPLGEYTPKQNDEIRAFRVLCHAEVEQFLEDCAASLGECLKLEIANARCGSPFTRAFANKSLQRLSNKISDNHGVNEGHLLSLFGLFGIHEEHFDSIDSNFLKRMNTFGKNRGEVAHKAACRMTVALNPKREEKLIDEILQYLQKLDDLVQQKRLHGIMGQ